MAILKSRFGKDGVIFQDIKFDNATIQIDMGESKGGRTTTEYKKDTDTKNLQRVNSVLEATKARNRALSGPTEEGVEAT